MGTRMKRLLPEWLGVAVTVAFSALLPGALCAQNPPWGVVTVQPEPLEFSYTVEQVYFKQPRTYKDVASKIETAMIAIKVTVYGRGFKDQDTGPAVWLNRVRSHAIRVSPEGDIIEAYFFHPYRDFERIARELQAWELIYTPHVGSKEIYRIGPRGRKSNNPKALAARPPTRLLTNAEWHHAEELAKKFGVAMPPR